MTRWRTSALLDLPALASDVPAGILGSDCKCLERRFCFPDVGRLDGFFVGRPGELCSVGSICGDAILDVDSAYYLGREIENFSESSRTTKVK